MFPKHLDVAFFLDGSLEVIAKVLQLSQDGEMLGEQTELCSGHLGLLSMDQ